MSDTIHSGFHSLSEKTTQYHSHIISLFSGVIIGFLTNYLVNFMFPLPYWYGLGLSFILLIFSIYLFLLYSPETSIGYAEQIIPQTLHEYYHSNFKKLLGYIKEDWEGYAFHKNSTAPNWQAPISNAKVIIRQISSHQGNITLEYPFIYILKCRFKIILFITALTEVPEYRKVTVSIQMNICAKVHPKSDHVLRTLGDRLYHAVTNPQIFDSEMPDEQWHKILKEVKPQVWEAYVNRKKTH